jgi:hypothetical protein
MKLFWLWLSQFSCLTLMLGLIFSTVLLFKLFGTNHDTCENSFFAYYYSNNITYNTTESECCLTEQGKNIFISYYVFYVIGNLILLFVYFYTCVIDDLCCLTNTYLKCIGGVCLIPITYAITIIHMTAYVFWVPAIRNKNRVNNFNRKWMGYSKRNYRSLFTIIQTLYLLENGLEITIVCGLYLSQFSDYYLVILSIFATINLLTRVFLYVPRFVKYFLEGLDHCRELCCTETDLNYGEDLMEQPHEGTRLNV